MLNMEDEEPFSLDFILSKRRTEDEATSLFMVSFMKGDLSKRDPTRMQDFADLHRKAHLQPF